MLRHSHNRNVFSDQVKGLAPEIKKAISTSTARQVTFVKIAPFNLEKILIPTSTARSVGFIFAKKNLRKFEKLHMLQSSKIYRHIWITYRGDAVAKEMEQRYFVSVDTNIVFVFSFLFYLFMYFHLSGTLPLWTKKLIKEQRRRSRLLPVAVKDPVSSMTLARSGLSSGSQVLLLTLKIFFF